jgi:hypothetical protein
MIPDLPAAAQAWQRTLCWIKEQMQNGKHTLKSALNWEKERRSRPASKVTDVDSAYAPTIASVRRAIAGERRWRLAGAIMGGSSSPSASRADWSLGIGHASIPERSILNADSS